MTEPCAASAEPEYVTRERAAAILHVSTHTIDRYANKGDLHRYRVGERRTLYRTSEVRALIKDKPERKDPR